MKNNDVNNVSKGFEDYGQIVWVCPHQPLFIHLFANQLHCHCAGDVDKCKAVFSYCTHPLLLLSRSHPNDFTPCCLPRRSHQSASDISLQLQAQKQKVAALAEQWEKEWVAESLQPPPANSCGAPGGVAPAGSNGASVDGGSKGGSDNPTPSKGGLLGGSRGGSGGMACAPYRYVSSPAVAKLSEQLVSVRWVSLFLGTTWQAMRYACAVGSASIILPILLQFQPTEYI